MKIDILPFNENHQDGVDTLMAAIAEEFGDTIFSPVVKPMSELYLLQGRHYWVALANGTVIGTIGVVVFPNDFAVMKSFFLSKDHRGTKDQVAQKLLDGIMLKATEHNCKHMYLGTLERFKAAHRFYEKNGFTCIKKSKLPPHYPANEIDTVFYSRKIS